MGGQWEGTSGWVWALGSVATSWKVQDSALAKAEASVGQTAEAWGPGMELGSEQDSGGRTSSDLASEPAWERVLARAWGLRWAREYSLERGSAAGTARVWAVGSAVVLAQVTAGWSAGRRAEARRWV